MNVLELVRLGSLMARTSGRPDVLVAVIDGPVLMEDPTLWGRKVQQLGRAPATCERADSPACMHGTRVVSLLAAKRNSGTPAICPDCTLMVRPIFSENGSASTKGVPHATSGQLAEAIVESVDGGAKVLNLSVSVTGPLFGQTALDEALIYAAAREVITVAAIGNEAVGWDSPLTRHPWVVPVTACDATGQPVDGSTGGSSVAKWGLRAPGQNIPSIDAAGKLSAVSGTSAAAPFVTGAAALLHSLFPRATGRTVKQALLGKRSGQRLSIVPPLLNAEAAYQSLVVGG